MAKTPHSSWNLSNIVLEGLLPAVFESADTAVDQRLPPVCDDYLIVHRGTDSKSFHGVLGGDLDDLLRIGRGQQHSRRPFVKQQQLRAQVRIEIDFGADASRSERG